MYDYTQKLFHVGPISFPSPKLISRWERKTKTENAFLISERKNRYLSPKKATFSRDGVFWQHGRE
jgi:hypothetical protein